MTPEERKAIAKRMGQGWMNTDYFPECETRYPKCCAYHEGFDDALALLAPALPATPWPKGTKFYGIAP